MTIGQKIVAFYLSALGQHENPPHSNRCPVADEAYRFVHDGADPAKASVDEREWCAETYCLAVFHAGVAHGPKTASTGGLFAIAKRGAQSLSAGKAAGSVVYDPRLPQGPHNDPGDIEVGDAALELAPKDKPTRTGFCHTTCVSSIDNVDDGILHTISGNRGDAVAYGDYSLRKMVVVRFAD